MNSPGKDNRLLIAENTMPVFPVLHHAQVMDAAHRVNGVEIICYGVR